MGLNRVTYKVWIDLGCKLHVAIWGLGGHMGWIECSLTGEETP